MNKHLKYDTSITDAKCIVKMGSAMKRRAQVYS
jgi:hypothetical protein